LLGSAQQLLAFGLTARPKSGQHTFPVLVALREHRPLMLYRRHTYRLRLLLSLAVAVDLTRLGFRHAAVSCARMRTGKGQPSRVPRNRRAGDRMATSARLNDYDPG
jgi:hypothetical protein